MRIAAAATFLVCSSLTPLAAQTYLHITVGGGPSTAYASGRSTRLALSSTCFTCKKTDELVTGATQGKSHASITVTGDPSKIGLALRFEGFFNNASSAPGPQPAVDCRRFTCEQSRTALVDRAFGLGVGAEYTPMSWRGLAPHVFAVGGIDLNRMQWSRDSTSTLAGTSVAFGPFVGAGLGISARFRQFAAVVEYKRFFTFVTSGSSMSHVTIGLRYALRLAKDDTEY